MLAFAAFGCTPPADASGKGVEWARYGSEQSANRFSSAAAITTTNVAKLRVAWRTRVDNARMDSAAWARLRFETTPLMVDGTLFVHTPLRVFALDPTRGRKRWEYDLGIDLRRGYAEGLTTRGLAYWRDTSTTSICAQRVIIATVDARLVSLDAASGEPCTTFGAGGAVQLGATAGATDTEIRGGAYSVTSPPTVVNDMVIVGSTVSWSRMRADSAGVVQAFDVRTGARHWSFNPGTNAWSVFTADSARDLVFVPTAGPAPAYIGVTRAGKNEHANSVVALRASTGKRVWSYQVVHHDLWDYDVATPPLLLTLRRDGEVPALVIGTKTGTLVVLDRETGVPLFPITERQVPRVGVEGEKPSWTQPFALPSLSLIGSTLTADSLFGVDAAERAHCVNAFDRLRHKGAFTPPGSTETLVWPGVWGGINWDGLAWDPDRRVLIVALKRLAMIVALDSSVRRLRPEAGVEVLQQRGTRYVARRRHFVSASGVPCTPPPWSELVAVQLDSPSVRWRRPLGSMPWLSRYESYQQWGSITFGGPLLTSTGLLFIAAGQDDMFRAFDTTNGQLVWEAKLPAGGQAAPMTYTIADRQYIVIAAGGRMGIGSPGAWIVAYSLPD